MNEELLFGVGAICFLIMIPILLIIELKVIYWIEDKRYKKFHSVDRAELILAVPFLILMSVIFFAIASIFEEYRILSILASMQMMVALCSLAAYKNIEYRYRFELGGWGVVVETPPLNMIDTNTRPNQIKESK